MQLSIAGVATEGRGMMNPYTEEELKIFRLGAQFDKTTRFMKTIDTLLGRVYCLERQRNALRKNILLPEFTERDKSTPLPCLEEESS